ncbi:MAG TPA: hypothetical protein VMW19_06805 [Myxococcota bacterium]|nr:hypothetical protein [Myxococcota bacterium]
MKIEASEWQITPEPALEHYTVEWAEEGDLLLSRRNRLYRTASPDAPPTAIATFPAPRWRSAAARFRPAQRMLRFLFYNVVKLADGSVFATFDDDIGVLSGEGFEPIRGLLRPCRVLRGACASGPDGNLYFGEYLSNAERGPVHLYRHRPGSRELEVAHRFDAGAIRHVHGIYHDPFGQSLWCLTGDRGKECRVAVSRDGFRTLDVVGEGDETWRCVSALFTESAIYYGSDAEFQPNHLYRIDRATGRRDVLGVIDGPVYYSYACGSDLFFAVTAELCPSQVGRSATLWHVSSSGRMTRVASFEKDTLSVRFFLPGTLHFPRGPGCSRGFWIHGVALEAADDRTFAVRPA